MGGQQRHTVHGALGRHAVQLKPFLMETSCTCAVLLKTGHFLIYRFILTSLVPFFFLYLVHVYIVSRIAQKRNNIKRIIFVVLDRAPFHLCAPAPEQQPPHPLPTIQPDRM